MRCDNIILGSLYWTILNFFAIIICFIDYDFFNCDFCLVRDIIDNLIDKDIETFIIELMI